MSLLGLASVLAKLAHKTVRGAQQEKTDRLEIPFYLDQLEELVHADQLEQVLDGGLQATVSPVACNPPSRIRYVVTFFVSGLKTLLLFS